MSKIMMHKLIRHKNRNREKKKRNIEYLRKGKKKRKNWKIPLNRINIVLLNIYCQI